jgi:2-methylaconitate cis-trans-isomerase PrpF
VAHAFAQGLPTVSGDYTEVEVGIENPAGILDATIEARLLPAGLEVSRAAYRRSAQILLRGHVPLYRASHALHESLLPLCGEGLK